MGVYSMNVLFVASEVVPLAKTGGLADVVSSLASFLQSEGNSVRIVIPYYKSIKDKELETETVLDSMCVKMGPGIEEWCSVKELKGTGSVSVWLIEHDEFFNREGLYHDNEFNDYWDNPKRYAFLSRAALQVAIDTNFVLDVIHIHDWQSALVAAYQKLWFWDNPIVGSAATVLTIHNARYQGIYGKDNYEYFGFDWSHFNSDSFEDHDRVNMLKAGIHFADVVNTVSPTHAKEIATPHSEFGLDYYLNKKGDHFTGILNGIDYEEWCPENDTLIPENFSKDNLAGKSICKASLQQAFGLDERPEVPIVGIVGRLVEQKGYHLVTPVLDHILETMDVQFAFLGSGDKSLEAYLISLPEKYPGKFGSWIGYSNQKAHLVEAGADMFLMPSMFEPCGLNQIYSLKYGTLPIVRAVGGLEDTVENYNPHDGHGTGFKFEMATSEAVLGTIEWAIETWYKRPKHFALLRNHAMKQNFSWDISGHHYIAFYEQAMGSKRVYDESYWDEKIAEKAVENVIAKALKV